MKKSMVKCPECKGEFNAAKVKFIDIESDIQGIDLMTWECPTCKCSKKTVITLKW